MTMSVPCGFKRRYKPTAATVKKIMEMKKKNIAICQVKKVRRRLVDVNLLEIAATH